MIGEVGCGDVSGLGPGEDKCDAGVGEGEGGGKGEFYGVDCMGGKTKGSCVLECVKMEEVGATDEILETGE